jgi:hypothetical protein
MWKHSWWLRGYGCWTGSGVLYGTGGFRDIYRDGMIDAYYTAMISLDRTGE